jgi:hypothetical protein
VNAEFNVWLLIVGLVVGAGLVWLVVMDSRRRESEVDAVELPREAAWLSAVMREDGDDVSPEAAERLLLLHRAYLDAPPPDAPTWPEDVEDAGAVDVVEEADDPDAVTPDQVGGSELPEQDRVGIDSGARSVDQ